MTVLLNRPEPGIALLSLSNPNCRNALGIAEFEQLARAWDTIEHDSSLRCVVITGEGTTAFCSGARLGEDFSTVPDINQLVDRALLKTRVFPLPLVAAVNGHCVAGGLELMLACDVRIVSAAARLGLPEVRWGIVPSGGGALKLLEQIGHAPALRLLLTGDLVGAQEALRIGLVNEVCAPADVLARALEIARTIAANSPLAVSHTKRLALSGRAELWASREPAERLSADLLRNSKDAELGREAFLEKTNPVY